ncbi:MAG: class I SAM-dependent methyltransferase [Firmicutes bacterium]|nr:class I SAM-dependent methyltransferase [Bacillota bacterium]
MTDAPYLITDTDRSETRERAQQMAALLHLPYLPRQGRSIAALCGTSRGVFVVEQKALAFYAPGSKTAFRYHPSSAIPRIRDASKGIADPLLVACEVQKGDRVLDATLGLGADALVLSWGIGEEGELIALEHSLPIAVVVCDGLRRYQSNRATIDAAMRRIRVFHADHRHFLRHAESSSFDIIYFDPMFVHPRYASAGIAPLRALADPRPLSGDTLALARRVARRRVVVKAEAEQVCWGKADRLIRTHSGLYYHVFEAASRS